MKTLRDIACGNTVKVKKIVGVGPVKRRIMDMGITKGIEIYIRKVAPLGDKTIGVAVSDLMGLTAQGVKTIKRVGKKKDIEALKEIIKERQVNKIVSGLPKNMNGTLGPQGEKVIKFCELLEEETGIKIEYWDERLSTVAAERTLIQGNVRRENRKGVIDMVAAVIILQGYLDRQRNF